MKKFLYLLPLAGALAPLTALAQSKDIISVNPLAGPAGILQVQYESGSDKSSIGVELDYFNELGTSKNKYSYQSAYFFLRRFLYGSIGQGTSIETSIGATNIKNHTDFFFENRAETVFHSSQIMAGVGLNHSRTLQVGMKVTVEGGVGVKRSLYIISKNDEHHWQEVPRLLPHIKMLVGFPLN